MGPTHLHGALPGGQAWCWDSHPSSPTHHSSRWCQPLYRLKTSEMERCERVYHTGSQEAGCWALNPVSDDLQSVFPPPQGVGWLRLASWRDAAHTGLPGWVLCGAGCWLPCVRGCWMFQSCRVHSTHLSSSTRQTKPLVVRNASEVEGCQP